MGKLANDPESPPPGSGAFDPRKASPAPLALPRAAEGRVADPAEPVGDVLICGGKPAQKYKIKKTKNNKKQT